MKLAVRGIIWLTLVTWSVAYTPCQWYQSGRFYHGPAQDLKTNPPPFTVVLETANGSAVHTYNTFEVYTIRLKATNDKAVFRSFLIQPRTTTQEKRVVEQKVGEFIVDDTWENKGLSFESCSPLVNDSVSRSELNDSLTSINLKWRSPIRSLGPIQFVVTIVSEPTLFWESWLPTSALLQPNSLEKVEKPKGEKSNEALAVQADVTKADNVTQTTKKPEDPCTDNECKHGAPCIANGTSYSCKCPENFVGPFCQWECPSYLCKNGGTCNIDNAVNYICTCAPAWTGNHCEDPLNKTEGITPLSLSSLKASDTTGGSTSGSTITSTTTLSTISSSASSATSLTGSSTTGGATKGTDEPSSSTGTSSSSSTSTSISSTASSSSASTGSSSTGSSATSTSSTPPTPSTTQKPTTPSQGELNRPLVNELVDKLFKDNGGITENGIPNFKIPNACSKNDCQNGAECIPGKRNYTCKCTGEFGGKLCQWPCPSYLCQNGGTCLIDESRVYKCACTEGFRGEKCEQKNVTDAITQPPTGPQSFANNTDVWLSIKSLFIPDKEVQKLIDDRFKNTAEQFDSKILQQIDDAPIDNRRRVKFLEGAEVKKSPNELLKILLESDLCENVYCYNNGTCVVPADKTKKPECSCPEGWLGPRCGTKNFCTKNKCDNGAECVNGDFDYTCKCRSDFSGKFCSVQCSSSSLCDNGGTCFYDEQENFKSKYKCLCQPGFTGERCQKPIDDCAEGPCYNGATCIDKVNGYECRCTKGHMGTKCQKPCGDSYTKCPKWKEEGRCSGGNPNVTKFYEMNCAASCGFCTFDNSTARDALPLSAMLDQLEFMVGKWVINTSDTRNFPFDLTDSKTGYYQELLVAQSELLLLGNPALNYTSIIIPNDNPSKKQIRVGLITVHSNGTAANGTVYTTGNDGWTLKEEGDLRYGRLELRTEFVDPIPNGEEDKITSTISRTFSIAGSYLKEAIERKSNTSGSVYFTKYYFKSDK